MKWCFEVFFVVVFVFSKGVEVQTFYSNFPFQFLKVTTLIWKVLSHENMLIFTLWHCVSSCNFNIPHIQNILVIFSDITSIFKVASVDIITFFHLQKVIRCKWICYLWAGLTHILSIVIPWPFLLYELHFNNKQVSILIYIWYIPHIFLLQVAKYRRIYMVFYYNVVVFFLWLLFWKSSMNFILTRHKNKIKIQLCYLLRFVDFCQRTHRAASTFQKRGKKKKCLSAWKSPDLCSQCVAVTLAKFWALNSLKRQNLGARTCV